MTSTRCAAESIVRSVRYPPLGDRKGGPFYAPLRWGLLMREYLDRADGEVLAIGTIEHIDALKSISEILSVPGLDLCLLDRGTLQPPWALRGKRIIRTSYQ